MNKKTEESVEELLKRDLLLEKDACKNARRECISTPSINFTLILHYIFQTLL